VEEPNPDSHGEDVGVAGHLMDHRGHVPKIQEILIMLIVVVDVVVQIFLEIVIAVDVLVVKNFYSIFLK